MSQSSTTITLPICTIQTDFKSLIEDVRNGAVPEDTFWISCYKTGEPSVHGKVHLTLNEIDRDLVVYEGTEGVEFEVDGDGSFAAKCSALDISHTKIVMPIKAYSDRLPQSTQGVGKKISAFDVAPDGSRFVTAYDDGSVYISPTSTATSPGTIMSKCHLSTVTSVRFFPSSRVLLTASSDFSLSILSAELPPPSAATPNNGPIRISSVRTFKGHSRGVTSTAIIARGRTILSGSKDGTVRLWDVSSGSQIRMWGTSKFTSIFSTSVGEQGEGAFTGHPDGEESNKIPMPMDPKEVDTADKVAFCGLSDGTFEAFDLGTKLSVFRSSSNRSSSPLHSITYSPSHNLLATGSGAGVVRVYDTRSLGEPLVSFARNAACIEDLTFLALSPSEVGLAVATEDGLPYIAHVRPEGPSVRAELVGSDCDAVRHIRVGTGKGEMWTAADDGVVRRYENLYA